MKRPSISLMLTAVLIVIKVVKLALLFQEKDSLPAEIYLTIPFVAWAFNSMTSILVNALRGEEYMPAMTWRKWDFKIISRKKEPIRFHFNLIWFAIFDVLLAMLLVGT